MDWEDCVKFHGHECPGLVLGYVASKIAQRQMGIEKSVDEEIVCVTENRASGVDAIQIILGCTYGKGNLIHKDLGKIAYNFFNRENGDSIRLVLKPLDKELSEKEFIEYYLEEPYEDKFIKTEVSYELPQKSRMYNTVKCGNCGEGTAENKVKLLRNKLICKTCYDKNVGKW